MVATLEVTDEYVASCRAAARLARRHLLANAAAGRMIAALARLAAHDAATFDANTRTGGPNGSVRVERELGRPENTNLEGALEFVEKVRSACPAVSYADLIQLCAAAALEMAGCDAIALSVGRKDSRACPPSGRVPDPSGGAAGMAAAFKRAGLEPRSVAALCGAFPFGGGAADTGALASDPLVVSNAYCKQVTSSPALDAVHQMLQEDDEMRAACQEFAKNGDAYAEALATGFKAMSELGCQGLTPLARGGGAGEKAAGAWEDAYAYYLAAAGAGAAAAAGYFWWARRQAPKATGA